MRKLNTPLTLSLLCGTALVASGCGGVKNPLQRTLPDETQVLAGPSLALPPSFELRPPREGTDTNEALLRTPGSTVGAVSGTTTDAWLIQRAQSEAGTVADPTIRADLDVKAEAETVQAKEEAKKQGLIQRWFKRNQ